MAAATIAPPRITSSTSTIVVRDSSLPPAAPKATPARAAPIATSATRGAWARDTRGRDLGQQREAPQRGDPRAQRDERAGQRKRGKRDQRNQQRDGEVVAGAG